ncbi:hypothetical protein EJ110_NYTH47300 [Nymphaea thermarum]|nr:hypothetical protein EJ110_NYTH47300 [Nymphaea thermarum]
MLMRSSYDWMVLLEIVTGRDHKWSNEAWLSELTNVLRISNSDHARELKSLISGKWVALDFPLKVGITVQKVVRYVTYPDDWKEEATGGQGNAAAPTKFEISSDKIACLLLKLNLDIGIPRQIQYLPKHAMALNRDRIGNSVHSLLCKRYAGDCNQKAYHFVLQSLYRKGDHKCSNEAWLSELRDALGISNSDQPRELKNMKHSFTAQADHCRFGYFINLRTLHCPEKGYLVNDTCVVEVAITVQKVIVYMTAGGQGGAAAPTKPINRLDSLADYSLSLVLIKLHLLLNLDIGKAVGCHTDQTADGSCFPHGLLIRIPHLDHVASGVGDSVLKELRWNGSLRDVNRMTYYFVLQSLYLQGDHKWKNEEWLVGLRDALAISNSDHVVELKRVTSGEYFHASSSSVMP